MCERSAVLWPLNVRVFMRKLGKFGRETAKIAKKDEHFAKSR